MVMGGKGVDFNLLINDVSILKFMEVYNIFKLKAVYRLTQATMLSKPLHKFECQ